MDSTRWSLGFLLLCFIWLVNMFTYWDFDMKIQFLPLKKKKSRTRGLADTLALAWSQPFRRGPLGPPGPQDQPSPLASGFPPQCRRKSCRLSVVTLSREIPRCTCFFLFHLSLRVNIGPGGKQNLKVIFKSKFTSSVFVRISIQTWFT